MPEKPRLVRYTDDVAALTAGCTIEQMLNEQQNSEQCQSGFFLLRKVGWDSSTTQYGHRGRNPRLFLWRSVTIFWHLNCGANVQMHLPSSPKNFIEIMAELNAIFTSKVTTRQYLLVPPFPWVAFSTKTDGINGWSSLTESTLPIWKASSALNNREQSVIDYPLQDSPHSV